MGIDVRGICVKIRNSQAFWILITGFHRMIHYLLVFFTVESYLVLPSYISHTLYIIDKVKVISGSVCKVRTQDTDNFDEEVKPLASAR